jgi:hypothetical protein
METVNDSDAYDTKLPVNVKTDQEINPPKRGAK